ncbi:MAG TPA: carboxy-S-adenosyl-L-methionine synthase CmoA [Gammaproteobacteria bacterium]|nr:carboxy-S-adenosyl-L-methionine synthase CmoA [Gammaproteobacteria bacterium]
MIVRGASPDRVFQQPLDRIADFEFNDTVAAVFDDMVSRSVPSYPEIQRMLVELGAYFATQGSNVYDLGCSTGTTLALLQQALPVEAKLHGVDSSPEMLKQCRTKLEAAGVGGAIELECADLDARVSIENASVVMLVLTLMFVRPLNRERLIGEIYGGLNDNGCLLLVEKVLGDGSLFNRLFIERYYAFKRRMGYSELEISQKREALENVLIPYRLQENRDLLLKAGFREVEVFFKWYNFAGFVAVK